MATSANNLYQLSTLVALLFLYPCFIFCSQPDLSIYNQHCSSIVPEATSVNPEHTTIPFPPNQDGYYLGGDEILSQLYSSSKYYYPSSNKKVLLFRTHHVFGTNDVGVYKVEATLLFQPSKIITSFGDSSLVVSSWSDRAALSFDIQGFWSKSTGKLCMVGHSISDETKLQGLSVLIKLYDVGSSNSITSLVKGTLESLSSADDSSYFQPISFMMFPLMNYTYTEANHGCTGDLDSTSTPKNSLSLPLSVSVCSVFSSYPSVSFKLEYESSCNPSSKSCNPFGNSVDYLPQFMSFTSIQCSSDKPSLRFLLEFPNSSYSRNYRQNSFNPNTSLVSEASWDSKKNQLCVVACRISTSTDHYSFNTSQVEDCSVRLSLRFPAVWSIGNTNSIVGGIWSNKSKDNSGYFDKIKFYSYGRDGNKIPGLKYKYTVVDEARKSCPKKQQKSRSGGKKYPNGINSYDMSFSMSVKDSIGRKFRWGHAYPVFLGDKIVPRNVYYSSFSSQELENSKNKTEIQPVNVSYQMSLTSYNASSKQYNDVLISAEGTYDGETGQLCMLGCKYPSLANESMDCEIAVNVEFSALRSGDYIEGQIKSKREKSSPLYFEPISFSGVPYYSHKQSIWRMDVEIIMALISNTLVCFFIGYQMLYMKKYPSVFPFVSVLMLAVLTLGRSVPLVLNFEALFLQRQNTQPSFVGGWLEANEVIVRMVEMVAFLLQFRLLQLVWSARFAENKKATWAAEKKSVYMCLPLYAIGGLISLSVHWKDYNFDNEMSSSYYISSSNISHSLWVDLRSYAGLVQDFFLFPQIIFNIFHNSRENALSCLFYVGSTLVRLIPHAYDLYRAHFYVDDWSYIYADKAADYYSTAWDLIIPLGGLVFAAIISLQQRKGGRCFLPRKFQEVEVYEKLPMAENA